MFKNEHYHYSSILNKMQELHFHYFSHVGQPFDRKKSKPSLHSFGSLLAERAGRCFLTECASSAHSGVMNSNLSLLIKAILCRQICANPPTYGILTVWKFSIWGSTKDHCGNKNRFLQFFYGGSRKDSDA